MAKTAFTTPDHLWEWTRMLFGLSNTTATFQRLMTRAIGHLILKYGNLVLCYVDDILIATSTIEEHLERFDGVFMCLARGGLKLKAAKCNLMKRCIAFVHSMMLHAFKIKQKIHKLNDINKQNKLYC